MEMINKLMTKKTVLLIGIIGSVLLFSPAMYNQFVGCYGKNLYFCSDSYEIIAALAIVSFPVLLFSLLTLFMREEIFRAWWNFARKWVVIIILSTLFFEYMGGGGGYLGMGQDFMFLVLGILYAIMIVGSIVRIVKTYLKTR